MAKHKSIWQQIGAYLVSGGAFFWSGYTAFAVFDGLLSLAFLPAKMLANAVGLTVNYLLQDKWVFSHTRHARKRRTSVLRYGLATAGMLLVDYLIVAGLKLVGVTPYIGQFISAGFFTVVNFVLYKYWVFAHKDKK